MSDKVRIRSWQDTYVEIDGRKIHFAVKRLDISEAMHADRLSRRALNPHAARLTSARLTAEEQERTNYSAIDGPTLTAYRARLASLLRDADARPILRELLDVLKPTDRFVIPDEDIANRRIAEMTEAQRAELAKVEAEDVQAYAAFLNDVLAKYVRVKPDQIEIEYVDTGETKDVENGAELARAYGGQPAVMFAIATEVRVLQRITVDLKKELGSRSDSRPSLNERDPTVNGPSSAPTADAVSASASAASEAATATEGNPSGPTAT